MRKRQYRLDAGVEASGPHDFAVRFNRVRPSRQSVHRIPHPTSVTIAKRPSCGHGTREKVLVICPTSQAKMRATDWHDGQISRHSRSRQRVRATRGPMTGSVAVRNPFVKTTSRKMNSEPVPGGASQKRHDNYQRSFRPPVDSGLSRGMDVVTSAGLGRISGSPKTAAYASENFEFARML